VTGATLRYGPGDRIEYLDWDGSAVTATVVEAHVKLKNDEPGYSLDNGHWCNDRDVVPTRLSMGADLFTCMLVGPKRLSRSKKTTLAAIREVQHTLLTLSQWKAHILGALPMPELPPQMAAQPELEEFEYLLNIEPQVAVMELQNLWAGLTDARDVNMRDYGDKQILVAGSMSWGDEPDGEGYRICKQSHALGLFKVYGIE
jgi:hypothetical protein